MSHNIILNNVEKFLKKEAETSNHNEDKQSKWKSVLRFLPDDDCFAILDNECSIKCIFDEESLKKELEKKEKKDLDSKYYSL